MNLTPFGELFKSSWELYKKKISVLAVLFAVPFVVNVLAAIVSGRQVATSTSTGVLGALSPFGFAAVGTTALAFTLVAFVVSLWIQVASVYAIDSAEEKPSISDLLAKSWPMLLPYLLVAILVGLAVLGGLILLIVPGIIFALWFSFSTFTLVLEGKRGTEALKASKAMVSGRLGAIFGRFILLALSLLGISIVASIVLAFLPATLRQIGGSALSSFVTSPLSLIFAYLLYKEVKAKGSVAAAPAPTTPAAPAAS